MCLFLMLQTLVAFNKIEYLFLYLKVVSHLFFRYPVLMEIDFDLSFQITRVIKEVRKSLTMMPCFCPKDVIFVLNKWDMIRKEEEKQEFLYITRAKLRELWKEIEDTNIKTLAAVSCYFLIERAKCSWKNCVTLKQIK